MLSILLTSLLLPFLLTPPLSADEKNQDDNHHAKIVGGYFEEWSIYFAGYNISKRMGLPTNSLTLPYAAHPSLPWPHWTVESPTMRRV